MKNMIHVLSITGLISILFISAIESLTLQFRLPNGILKRFEVNKENDTISDLNYKLQDVCDISPANPVNISIKGNVYEYTEIQSNCTKIAETSLVNGDIITILSFKKGVNDEISPTTTNNIIGDNNNNNHISKTNKIFTNSLKKKASKSQSIADLEKRKKELINIKRQKSKESRIVKISSSVARILKRLSEKNGIAILGGRNYNDSEPLNVKDNKNIKSKMITKQKSINSKQSVDKIKENFDIITIAELFICDDNTKTIPNDLQFVDIDNINKIFNSLGLETIGIAVCTGDDKVWSDNHIHISLQIKEKLKSINLNCDNKTFVILSVNKESDINSSEKSKSKTIKNKKSYNNKLNDKSFGVSLEAFHLSDCGIEAFQRNVLSLYKVENNKSVVNNKKIKTMTAASSSFRNNNDNENDKDEIQLAGNVLLKNEETDKIDSYLLAVPIAISALNNNNNNNNNNKTNSPIFDHTFPTPSELNNNTINSISKTFLIKLLKKVKFNIPLAEDTVNRLRDVHLLLFLGSLIDKNSLEILLDSLSINSNNNNKEIILPSSLAMVLNLVKDSLQFEDSEDD